MLHSPYKAMFTFVFIFVFFVYVFVFGIVFIFLFDLVNCVYPLKIRLVALQWVISSHGRHRRQPFINLDLQVRTLVVVFLNPFHESALL